MRPVRTKIRRHTCKPAKLWLARRNHLNKMWFSGAECGHQLLQQHRRWWKWYLRLVNVWADAHTDSKHHWTPDEKGAKEFLLHCRKDLGRDVSMGHILWDWVVFMDIWELRDVMVVIDHMMDNYTKMNAWYEAQRL